MFTETTNIKQKLKNTLPNWSISIWLLWCVTAAFFIALSSTRREAETLEEYVFLILLSVFVGLGVGTFYYIIWFLAKWILNFIIDKRVLVTGLTSKAEHLQDTLETDFFNNLVKLNFKYLDRYYLQTQIQANKSFIVSVAASLVGFSIIISGIIMMYLGNTEPAYVTTGAGLISEFIAAIFFYLYNRTIVKMSEYHQKLVLTQNIALALKISQSLPETERIKTQMNLVDSLIKDINIYLTIYPSIDKVNNIDQISKSA
jgi:hypothetical protein